MFILVAVAIVIALCASGSSDAQKAADRIGDSTPETSDSRATLRQSISDTNGDIGWMLIANVLLCGAICMLFGPIGIAVCVGLWVLVKAKVLT